MMITMMHDGDSIAGFFVKLNVICGFWIKPPAVKVPAM